MKRFGIGTFAGLGTLFLSLLPGSFLTGCGDKAATGPVTVTQGVTLIATPLPSGVAGRDWNYAALNTDFSGRYNLGGATFNNKMWIIGGVTCGYHLFNDVWSSTNGSAWTQVLADTASPGSNQFIERAEQAVLVFNNKLWVLGGTFSYDGISFLNDVWYSPDGATWTQALADNAAAVPDQFSQRRSPGALVYNGKMWIIGGQISSGYANDVWSSTDGATWTQVLANAPSPGGSQFPVRGYFTSLVYGGKMWVIGGLNNGGNLNDVWSSTDGSTWTNVLSNNPTPGANQFSQRDFLQSVVYGDAMWVIGGASTGYNNDVWYSTDGSTWTAITASAAFPSRDAFVSLIFNSKMWVIGGVGATCYNDVWYSPF